MTYETRVTRLLVVPEGEPSYSEMATVVEIDNEAAGEFVTVTQHMADKVHTVRIDPQEWTAIRDAIERLVKECR